MYYFCTSYSKWVQDIFFKKLCGKFYSIMYIWKKPYHVYRGFPVFCTKFYTRYNRNFHGRSQFFHYINIIHGMMVCYCNTFYML